MKRLTLALRWLIFKVQNSKASWKVWFEDQANLASLEAAAGEPVRDYDAFLEEIASIYDD